MWGANAKEIEKDITECLGVCIGGSHNPLGLHFSVGPPNDTMDPLLSSPSFS